MKVASGILMLIFGSLASVYLFFGIAHLSNDGRILLVGSGTFIFFIIGGAISIFGMSVWELGIMGCSMSVIASIGAIIISLFLRPIPLDFYDNSFVSAAIAVIITIGLGIICTLMTIPALIFLIRRKEDFQR